MKKYILFFAVAVAAVFGSCTNDEIEISRNLSFKVKPNKVVSSFTMENDAGELSSVLDGYKLRIKLLVYDENGLLVYKDSALVANYETPLTCQKMLPVGNYTAIAVTDVVGYKNGKINREYWHMSGTDNINTVKVQNTGWLAFTNCILGVGAKKVTIDDNSQDVTLEPKAAGALFLVEYYHIHYYDVINYELLTNRTCDFITFDSNGNAETTNENIGNEFKWRNSVLTPSDYTEYTSVYDYAFVFPTMTSSKYKFVTWYYADTNNTDMRSLDLCDEIVIPTIKAGEEYLFQLDMDSDGNGTWDVNYQKVANAAARQAQPAKQMGRTPKMLKRNEAPMLTNPFQEMMPMAKEKKLIDLIEK